MLNKLKTWFTCRLEDLKALRRGEVRTAEDGVRGRVFQKRKGGVSAAVGRGKVNVEMLITRADGTVEKRKVPGTMSFFKH